MTKNTASLETTLKVTYMEAHHLGRLQLYSKIEDHPKSFLVTYALAYFVPQLVTTIKSFKTFPPEPAPACPAGPYPKFEEGSPENAIASRSRTFSQVNLKKLFFDLRIFVLS
jgi:hypothetical protein